MRSREGVAAAQAACSAGNRSDSSAAAADSAGQSGEDGDMLLQPRQCSSNELTEPSGKKKEIICTIRRNRKRLRRCEL